jgi:hypothetical protein
MQAEHVDNRKKSFAFLSSFMHYLICLPCWNRSQGFAIIDAWPLPSLPGLATLDADVWYTQDTSEECNQESIVPELVNIPMKSPFLPS